MEIEDQRDVELSSLSAIFPEIQKLHEDDPYTFALDVPVNPTEPVTVLFPAATTEGQDVNTAATQIPGRTATTIDSHELAHLPAVRLVFSLPPAYPTDQPPSITISTTPSWLPLETAKRLEDDCMRMWEELGRDLVLFSYIDHVQQSADDVFGLVGNSGGLEIHPEHKIAVLDHDIKAKQQAFDNETYDCGVCLGTLLHFAGFAAYETRRVPSAYSTCLLTIDELWIGLPCSLVSSSGSWRDSWGYYACDGP